MKKYDYLQMTIMITVAALGLRCFLYYLRLSSY
jgi:hypothetical protein